MNRVFIERRECDIQSYKLIIEKGLIKNCNNVTIYGNVRIRYVNLNDGKVRLHPVTTKHTTKVVRLCKKLS